MEEKEKHSRNFIKVLERHGIPADVVKLQIHRIKKLSIQTEHRVFIKKDYFDANQKKFEEIFKDVPSYSYGIGLNLMADGDGELYFNGDCMKELVCRSEASIRVSEISAASSPPVSPVTGRGSSAMFHHPAAPQPQAPPIVSLSQQSSVSGVMPSPAGNGVS